MRDKLRRIYLLFLIVNFFRFLKSILFSKIFIFYFYNNFFTWIPSNSLRIFYLKYLTKFKIGEKVFICLGCRFTGNISIGNNSVLGRKVVIKGEGGVEIGQNVGIVAESYIQTGTHYLNDINFKSYAKKIIIKNNVWIGLRSIILPGLTLERGSVLGAGSVLTKNLPQYNVYGGVPATFIKKRDKINYKINYKEFLE